MDTALSRSLIKVFKQTFCCDLYNNETSAEFGETVYNEILQWTFVASSVEDRENEKLNVNVCTG